MRKIFTCYQDHKKWTKGKFCQPKAAGRGLVMFPRFAFCDRDNMEKLSEYFQIYLRRCMKQEKQCNRVLFFIFSSIFTPRPMRDRKNLCLGLEKYEKIFGQFFFHAENTGKMKKKQVDSITFTLAWQHNGNVCSSQHALGICLKSKSIQRDLTSKLSN